MDDDATARKALDRPPMAREVRRVLLWVGALAAVVRLAYLTEHAGSAFFGVPILDERYYDALARALASGGDVARLDPGFRPLLYPLFLAFFYRLGGDGGYALALVAQHLLGVATALLVALVAIRLYRRAAAGAVAGGLYALAGPPLFFEGELLITTLFTFLVTVELWLVCGLEPRRRGRWLGAGAWTGLAAQARPNALLFLAAFPTAALALDRRRPLAPRLATAALALVGTLGALVAAAALQAPLLGRFELLPSSGGVNFYLGNRAGADGMVPRQERWVSYGDPYRDSVEVFAADGFRRATGRDGEPGEISRFWLGRGLEEIAREPGRWLALEGRKLLFLAGNREIPNNKSFEFVRREESSVLAWLPVRWWLLLALGGVGVVHAWRRGDRRALWWLTALLALHAAGVVLFFVNGRFRLPMWPAMAALAAGGALALVDAWRARDRRRLGAHAALAAALAALALVDWTGAEPPGKGRDPFFRSLAHLEKGRLAEAEADARRSLALDPSDPAARFQLGNVALARGDDALAEKSYREVLRQVPEEPRVHNNLGIVAERRGRPAAAYRAYLRALELAPDYAPALVNAALLELRAGLLERAEGRIARARELGFDSLQLAVAEALAAAARGRREEAERLLAEARRRDPELVGRLLEEQERRLSPRILGIQDG